MGGEAFMNRNVAIVIVILVVVVIAGYLVWIRSRIQQPVVPTVEPSAQATIIPSPTQTASPSASPKGATGSAKIKTSTTSSVSK